ncbi:DUF6325 family protein [Kitasatospora sp. NPDC059146]|uniref:DUF6325 family protein n=1 Tax=Kitasatospora sp. NPDC059146 TaxID=3346741 RepID=UPI003685783F
MDIGPVEYAVLAFPGNRFKGAILPELKRLTEDGTIRILDLAFIKRDEQGTVRVLELDALDVDEAAPFAEVNGEIMGLISDEDLTSICEEIPAGCSAAVIVWEHRWAAPLLRALADADGILVAREHVPHSVVTADLAALGL